MSTNNASEQPEDTPDRRTNPKLRALFEQAYEVLEPFYDAENLWNGQPLDQFAYHRLREAMPQLSSEECFILVLAARRVFGERHEPD